VPSSNFCPTEERRLSGVASFLQAVFSTSASSPLTALDFLSWKYFAPRPDWTGPRSYLLDSGGSITAHGAVWPLTLITPTGRHTAFNFIDWAAEASRPGAGVALLQQMSRLAEVVIVLGGSAMAQKILPVAGFKTSSLVRYFARPLRPVAQLARSWRWNWKAPARVGRNVLLRLAPPIRTVPGWSLDPIHPQELSEMLGARDQGSGGGARFARSPELIEYYLQCPIVRSQPYVLRRGQQGRGYCVITHAMHQARIVDAWVASDGLEEWRALFGLCLLRALESRQVCEIATFTSSESAAAALEASGFLPRGTQPLMFFSRSGLDLAGMPVYIQMLDCDASFRHEGTAQFWT
jgi:hypothetical protein